MGRLAVVSSFVLFLELLLVGMAAPAVLMAAMGVNNVDAGTLTIGDEEPSITWANPADIVYGTPLSDAHLNATASVPGAFQYTPGAGTVLNAGTGQTLHVDFTPADTVSYSGASMDVTINVSRAGVAVAADNVSKTYGEADPELTYRTIAGSLVGSDAFTGGLAREAGEGVGSYDIQQGTLALGGNYNLTFVGAGPGDGDAAQLPGEEAGICTPTCVGPGRVYRLRYSGSIAGPSESGHRIAEYGSSSLYLYWAEEAHDPSPPYVCVTQGDRVQHLGPLTDAVFYSNRTCWVDQSDFLVITGGYNGSDPDMVVMRYHVGDGIITLVGAAHFGDSNSRYLDMIKLDSGAIVMCWFQKAAFTQTPMYFSYTTDGLSWHTVTSSVTPGYLGQYKGALCQHPADGSVWFFGHGDSFHSMNGYRLVESAGTLSLDRADPAFIQGTGASNSELEPDPEYPCIVAIPDTASGTILLAYQRGADHVRWYWDGMQWSLDPTGFVTYVLISKVAVVDVQADGTCALRTVVDQYVERTSPFGIGLLPDGRLWFVGLSCDQSRTPQRMQRLVALTLPDCETLYLQGESDSVSDFVCSGNEVLYEAGDNDLFSLVWADGDGGGDDGGSVLGTFTITPREITVTADGRSKTCGEADPPLTYTYSPELGGGDTFSGALSREAGEEAGTYLINQGTLALSGDYTLTYFGANMTIHPPPPAISTAAPLPDATVGAAYSYNLTATGGTQCYSWSIDSGTLPAGLTLGSHGAIRGTPSAAGGPVDVTFRVTDGAAAASTAELSITVEKGTPAIRWADPAGIVYGTALSGAQLCAAASVPGAFVYTPAPGVVLSTGDGQTLHVDFTPVDTVNFHPASADVTIDVTPATIVVTAADRTKVYGGALVFAGSEFTADGLLNGDRVTSVSLTSQGADGPAAAADYDIVARCAVGEGLGNYAIRYVPGTLTVARADAPVSLVSSSESAGSVSGPVVLVVTVARAGATGTVTFRDGETTLVSMSLVGGAARCTVSSLPPGIHQVTAVYSGDANFAGSTSSALSLTVEASSGIRWGLVAALASAGAAGFLVLVLGRRLLER